MALADLRSNTERARLVNNIKNLLNDANRISASAEAYYLSASKDYAAELQVVHLNTNNRMSTWQLQIDLAVLELAQLADGANDNNMRFQYYWRVGTFGIGNMKFIDGGGSADSIELWDKLAADGGAAIADVFRISGGSTNVIVTGDVIKVEGTSLNDGIYTVTGVTSNKTIEVATGTLTAEEAEMSSATLTLWRHTY